MENQNTGSPSLFDLGFDENLKHNLKSTANIAGIAAIISIIAAGLNVVKYFVDQSRPVAEGFEEYENMARASSSFNLIGIVISLLISFLLFYFLNKFANQAKTGLAGNNQGIISESLGNLASYFKTLGIILIIILCFTLLIVLAALAGSAGA